MIMMWLLSGEITLMTITDINQPPTGNHYQHHQGVVMSDFPNGFRVVPSLDGCVVTDASNVRIDEDDIVKCLTFTSWDDFQDWCADYAMDMEGTAGRARGVSSDE
jgi:hypothetical protein